tara:strand:- start:56 stop:673 length:618 start_codon:yes stop_codon:yes gene_type:complete
MKYTSSKRSLSLLLTTTFLSPIGFLSTLSTKAEIYKAACDEQTREIHEATYPKPRFPDPDEPDPVIPKCTVDFVTNNQKITGPYQSIPTSRVTSWSLTGESKTDVSGKVAATVAFGVIGFLVSDPKKHDYLLVVNGYDVEGEKTFINMRFTDGKQPKKLMTQLPMLTGLGMGQKRTLKEIKKIEKEGISNNLDGSEGDPYPETLY